MIRWEKHGNIFEAAMQTLVCPVNTQGVMGAGLALAFKHAYPGLFESYRRACKRKVFKRDGFYVYTVNPRLKILCLPTKIFWRYPSKLEWIDKALGFVARDHAKHGIVSLAVPAIGCGKGQLEWEDVYPLIRKHLDSIDLPVGIYLP